MDAVGNPLSNGTYEVVFRISNKASPAEQVQRLIWCQTNQVAVIKGIFNMVLGGSSKGLLESATRRDIAEAFGGAERLLGITITRTPTCRVPGPSGIALCQQILSTP